MTRIAAHIRPPDNKNCNNLIVLVIALYHTLLAVTTTCQVVNNFAGISYQTTADRLYLILN